MRSKQFAKALAREARKAADTQQGDPAKDLRARLVIVNGQVSKAMDLALKLEDPAPALRKVNELEAERKKVAEEISRVEREHSAQAVLASITESQVSAFLATLADDFSTLPVERWKGLIRTIVAEVILDPATLECRIHYRIPVRDRLSMASPRGFEPLLQP